MPATPRFHILCVDDDADACSMLSELLKLSEMTCHCASSAAEAWSILRTERFDLYLLDAWLPDHDGFEFCRQLRAIDSTTPILFYSGAAYDSDRRKGLAAGANAYVVKPEVEGLVEAMSRLILEARDAAVEPHDAPIRELKEVQRRGAVVETSTICAVSSF